MNLRQLHAYNEVIAIIAATILNLLLLYCVLIEKGKFLKAYRMMILFNIFSEFVLIGVSSLLRHQLVIANGAFIIVINGSILEHASQSVIDFFAGVYVWALTLDVTKNLVDFLCRYWIVCWQLHPSFRRLLLLTIGIYVTAPSVALPLYFSFTSVDPRMKWSHVFADSQWLEEDGHKVRFAAADVFHWGSKVFVVFGNFYALWVYGLIFWCARRIVSELKRQSMIMSSKTVALQRGLNRMLFVQALVPIVITVVPCMFCFTSIALGYGSETLSLIVSMSICWTSCSSAACALYFVPSYRRRLTHLLLRGRIYHSSSAHPISIHATHESKLPTLHH